MIIQSIRPSRLQGSKGESYHLEYGRYVASAAFNNPINQKFRLKCDINNAFYKNDQWILEEDQEAFFLDDAGGYKNRIQVTQNLIAPIVNYFRGIIISNDHTAKLRSIDNRSSERKETEVKRLTAYQRLSEVPSLADTVKENVPLGDDINETLQLFESSYIDILVDDINLLTKQIAENIHFDVIKVEFAKSIAINGLAVYTSYDHHGNYQGESVDVTQFGWDPDAKRPDLADSTFFCEWFTADPVDLIERFKLTGSKRDALERVIDYIGRNDSTYKGNNLTEKPIVYKSTWLDLKKITLGWVEYSKGEFGLFRLDQNNKYYGKSVAKKSQLTKEQLEYTDGEVYQEIEVGEWRYCYFIPREDESIVYTEDVILEYGAVKYQDYDLQKPSEFTVPYKCFTWDYDKGEVLSPIDNIINPQRLINRITSIMESKINTAGGSGVVYDSNALSDELEEDFIGKINRGEPVAVDAQKVGGVNNAIGKYDASMSGENKLYTSIEAFRQTISRTTGFNDAMLGAGANSEMLVGVLDSQINRGSIIQQPFFMAMKKLIEYCYNDICNKGRKIAARNNRIINALVDDKTVKSIVVTAEMELEDMRAYVDIAEPEMTAIERGNQLLMTLYTAQLIDSVTFSELFNKSDTQAVARGLYRYQNMLDLSKQKAAEQKQTEEAITMEMIGQENAYNKEAEALKQQSDDDFRKEKLKSTERNSIRSHNAKINKN